MKKSYLKFVVFFLLASQQILADDALKILSDEPLESYLPVTTINSEFTRDEKVSVEIVTEGIEAISKLLKDRTFNLLIVDGTASRKFERLGIVEDKFSLLEKKFVLMGPRDDPMRIKGNSLEKALKKIIGNGGNIISCGFGEASNLIEQRMWKKLKTKVYRISAEKINEVHKRQISYSSPIEPWYHRLDKSLTECSELAVKINGYFLAEKTTLSASIDTIVDDDPMLKIDKVALFLNHSEPANINYTLAKKYVRLINPKAEKFEPTANRRERDPN